MTGKASRVEPSHGVESGGENDVAGGRRSGMICKPCVRNTPLRITPARGAFSLFSAHRLYPPEAGRPATDSFFVSVAGDHDWRHHLDYVESCHTHALRDDALTGYHRRRHSLVELFFTYVVKFVVPSAALGRESHAATHQEAYGQ